MDPRINPYSPGAGTQPPELSGRKHIITQAEIALDRCRNGLSARGLMLVGLRGVGKTVLLVHLAQRAEAEGFSVISIEVPEKRSLPALLIPALRAALFKLGPPDNLIKRGLRVLGSFVASMKLKYHDVEFSVSLEKEVGSADSGDLEYDLTALFVALGEMLRDKKTALGIFIDEIQYLEEDQFAALIMALHKCAQLRLPILLIGAGLPQLVSQAGRAKSYAERLFEYPEVGKLSEEAAEEALILPAKRLRVDFEPSAITEILAQTQCYPYFLQEWGKHAWEYAKKSPITKVDVNGATTLAVINLDVSFFRVRFDRLTPTEKKYLRAMAELGFNNVRSGDIAELLKKEVQSVAPTRASLIEKGMIYSPAHGDNAFTVPLFQDYLKRNTILFNE